MLKKSVTLKDVAKIAGVSTTTVARVLHNDGYIAERTRKLVESALQKTGYQLNIVAQGLRTQRTMSIGYLLQGTFPNPFFASVALGAEQEAQKHGWSVLVVNVHGDASRERAGVEALIQRRVDAILFIFPIDEANVRLALDAGLVVVQVERPTALSTYSVTVDNYVGSVAATEHLLALGHRRIAYIGGDPKYAYPSGSRTGKLVEEERLSGFLDTLRAHDIPVENDLIALGHYTSPDGYRYMKQFLQKNPRPTAVFATCDIFAMGVLQALYEYHLRVPTDISVIGFDDTYGLYLSPPLTTVQQPMEDIGRWAVRLALGHFRGNADHAMPSKQIRLSTRLILRSSTGPVPL